jgi:hypothetical protein
VASGQSASMHIHALEGRVGTLNAERKRSSQADVCKFARLVRTLPLIKNVLRASM